MSFGVAAMSSFLLRRLWTVIEEVQAGVLLRLSDTELVGRLMNRLTADYAVSPEEADTMSLYILAKANLIRDVAGSRQMS
jgi:hypothetical protein